MNSEQLRPAFIAAMAEACKQWLVTEEQILGRYRNQVEISARHCVCYAMRSLGASYHTIGYMLRGRDRGTAEHSVHQANNIIDVDTKFRAKAMAIREAARLAYEMTNNDTTASAVILGETQ